MRYLPTLVVVGSLVGLGCSSNNTCHAGLTGSCKYVYPSTSVIVAAKGTVDGDDAVGSAEGRDSLLIAVTTRRAPPPPDAGSDDAGDAAPLADAGDAGDDAGVADTVRYFFLSLPRIETGVRTLESIGALAWACPAATVELGFSDGACKGADGSPLPVTKQSVKGTLSVGSKDDKGDYVLDADVPANASGVSQDIYGRLHLSRQTTTQEGKCDCQ